MASAAEQAVRRLDEALRGLERVVALRVAQTVGAEGLAMEVANLTTDRARLAEDLDQTKARATRLEGVNRDVSRRLDAATAAVRAVLDADAQRR